MGGDYTEEKEGLQEKEKRRERGGFLFLPLRPSLPLLSSSFSTFFLFHFLSPAMQVHIVISLMLSLFPSALFPLLRLLLALPFLFSFSSSLSPPLHREWKLEGAHRRINDGVRACMHAGRLIRENRARSETPRGLRHLPPGFPHSLSPLVSFLPPRLPLSPSSFFHFLSSSSIMLTRSACTDIEVSLVRIDSHICFGSFFPFVFTPSARNFWYVAVRNCSSLRGINSFRSTGRNEEKTEKDKT